MSLVKPVPIEPFSFGLYYDISDDGKVYNKDGPVKPYHDNHGYVLVKLYDHEGKRTKIVRVHRLVAMAFIPNENNYTHVLHKDLDKENNTVSNLQWCSLKEFQAHVRTNQPDLKGKSWLASRKPSSDVT